MKQSSIRIGVVGAGYFSQFHLDAWTRLADVELVAICDRDPQLAAKTAHQYQIPNHFHDLASMLDTETLDAVDVITPPETHFDICLAIAQRGLHMICQKPLAPSYDIAKDIANLPAKYGIRLMVHENFRFQPWYRAMKQLWQEGTIGTHLHQLYIRTRMGDGWQTDAYLNRQPYFRTMPRLLIYETGIHFLDICRYIGGDISHVFSMLHRWNPAIQGEDAAFVHMTYHQGGVAIWDANRYNEPNYPNPRYTFGEATLEADQGTLRLYPDGRISIQRLGMQEVDHPYTHTDIGFAGDCVYATQQHFIECLQSNTPFETEVKDYLQTLLLQEAVYHAHQTKQAIWLDDMPTPYP